LRVIFAHHPASLASQTQPILHHDSPINQTSIIILIWTDLVLVVLLPHLPYNRNIKLVSVDLE